MARRALLNHMPQGKPDAHSDAPETAAAQSGPAAATDSGYFDQALFDLHYHLLAARTEGLPPLPDPAEYGITVDRDGNVTRKPAPPPPDLAP